MVSTRDNSAEDSGDLVRNQAEHGAAHEIWTDLDDAARARLAAYAKRGPFHEIRPADRGLLSWNLLHIGFGGRVSINDLGRSVLSAGEPAPVQSNEGAQS